MPMESGREVVIVEAARTPIGRGHKEKGYYKDTHPNALLGKRYRAVIERSGIPASEVEDVIAGCVQQFGPQAFNVGAQRLAAGGLPDRDRRPRRSTASAARPSRPSTSAAALIASGIHDVVIGGGVEHMGDLPFAAGMKTPGGVRLRVHAGAHGQAQHRRPGPRRRDDRRQVGDPAVGARRARRALAPARASGHRGGPLRARDDPDAGQRRHLRHRPGHPPRHQPRDAVAAEAGLQGGRQDHGRQRVADLRRRRRGAADDAPRRRRSSA